MRFFRIPQEIIMTLRLILEARHEIPIYERVLFNGGKAVWSCMLQRQKRLL